MTSRTQYWYIL